MEANQVVGPPEAVVISPLLGRQAVNVVCSLKSDVAG